MIFRTCFLAIYLAVVAAARIPSPAEFSPEQLVKHMHKQARKSVQALKSQGSHGQQASVGAMSYESSKLAVGYQYTDDECGGEPQSAVVITQGQCITMNSDGEKISFKSLCNEEYGVAMGVYLKSNCDGDPLAVFPFLVGPGHLDECLLTGEEYDDDFSDDDYYDDNIVSGDDDDITHLSYRYECVDSVGYDLQNATALGVYLDGHCGSLYAANYVKETECLAVNNDAASTSVTCGSTLTSKVFESNNECDGSPDEIKSYTTNKCIKATDEFDDDDSPFAAASMFATCDGSTLPESLGDAASPLAAAGWLSIAAMIACTFAAFRV